MDLHQYNWCVAWCSIPCVLQRYQDGYLEFGKLDSCLDYLVTKYNWNWLKQPEDAWRKKYPFVTKKIDELETRIKNLENGNS